MAEEKADEQSADAAGTGEQSGEPEGKKKKTLLFIVIGAVVIAGAAGGAAFFLLSPSKEKDAAHDQTSSETASEQHVPNPEDKAVDQPEGDASDKKSEDKPKSETATGDTSKTAPTEPEDQVDFGNTYTFKTFHLNLGNPLENHYIRLEIAVEFKGGEEQKNEIEKRLPQLRDAVVSVTSRKTREFLLGPDGKDQLRREILIRMNRYMTQPIESVFITDILIE